MPAVEELLIKIRADSRQFNREMAKTRKLAVTTGRAIKRGLALAGIAIGAGAIRQASANVLQLADSIDKVSEGLGIGAQRLQEWRFSANLAGVQNEKFDMALQRFIRRLGEARIGTGEARDAFKELGIDAATASQDVEQAFEDSIRKIASLNQDPARQLRLAFKLFDSEGARAAIQLAQSFDEGIQKAKDLGVVIDDQTIDSLVGLNDELTIFRQQLQTDWAAILSNLKDPIEDLVELFRRGSEFIGNWYRTLKALAGAALGGPFETQESVTPSARPPRARRGGLLDPTISAETVKEVDKLTKSIQSEWEGLYSGITSGFSSAMSQIITEGEVSFKELAKSFTTQFVDAVLQALVFLPLKEALFSAFGQGTTVVGTTSVTPRAFGGPVAAGRGYLVGERGPELFVPNVSGGIVANNQMGGAGFNLQIINTVSDDVEVRTREQPDTRTLRLEIARIVADDFKQNGLISAAGKSHFNWQRRGTRGI